MGLKKSNKDYHSKIGLNENARVILGAKEYVKINLYLAGELIQKAKWAKTEKQQLKYLLALKSIVDKCIKILTKPMEER